MKTANATEPLFRTKPGVLRDLLRGAIMRVELKPGQRLVIDEVARQYGVSAIPVREALQMLHAERLVDFRPHVGAVVAEVTEGSVQELFRLMEALSVLCVELACEKLSEEQIDQLAALVRQMEAAANARDAETWAELNARFHAAEPVLEGMPRLRELVGRTFAEWGRVRRFFFGPALVGRVVEAQSEHRAILKAIRHRDVEAARQGVRKHHHAALGAYLKLLKAPAQKKGKEAR